jgi:hypothetical protein
MFVLLLFLLWTDDHVQCRQVNENSVLPCLLHTGTWLPDDDDSNAVTNSTITGLLPIYDRFANGCPRWTKFLFDSHENKVFERLCIDKRPPLRALRFVHSCGVDMAELARSALESDVSIVFVGDSLLRQLGLNAVRCELENADVKHAVVPKIMYRGAPLVLSVDILRGILPTFHRLVRNESALVAALLPAVRFSLQSNWTANSVLVLNTGAWWSPSSVMRQGIGTEPLSAANIALLFRATILAIVEVLREISPLIGLIVWVATFPPHPLCDGVTRPSPEWNWNENAGARQRFALQQMRQLSKRLNNVALLDATELLSWRADAHPGHGDCLHFCALVPHSPLRAVANILLAEIASRLHLRRSSSP